LFTSARQNFVQPRNAENTKASIIKAARRIFEAKGYEMATLRDIADVAGCNVALIARYFGSKRGLFQRAVLDTVNLRWSLTAPDKRVAEALADYYTTQPRNTQEFDGFVTILRSFASPEVGPLISDTLVAQGLEPMIDIMDGPDARARAILLTAQLTGLIFHYRVLAINAQTPSEAEDVRALLLPYLEKLLGRTGARA
jgi:AcrR family transcriptional regulator